MSNLSLILAESSLEIIPKEIQNHPSVISHSKKLGKLPSNILLDNSWHYAAMKGIQNENKRGRPDIVHFSLLEACSIPLYFEKKLSIYVHTLNDKVIEVGDDIHLPKSFHRFAGLIEKLFYEKRIESNGKKLLEMSDMSFSELIEKIKPKNVVGLSCVGKSSSFCNVAKSLTNNSCLVIGGFQKSHFSDTTVSKIDHPEINDTVSKINKTWGGNFTIENITEWKKIISKKKKESVKIVHLTMYGLNINDVENKLRNEDKILIIVGAEKVPRDIFEMADYNVAIGNQPHSEVSALGVLLDRIQCGNQFESKFENSERAIIPQKQGKNVRMTKTSINNRK